MRRTVTTLLLVFVIQNAYAETAEVVGNRHVAFLDDFDPIEVPVTTNTQVRLNSSDMRYESTRPDSRVDQVVVWYVTYNNPCGYFWVASLGSPVDLPSNGGTAKIFVLEYGDISDNSGTAVVSVGGTVVTIDAVLNAVALSADTSCAIDIPASHESTVKVLASTIALGGTLTRLGKVIVFDPGSQTPTEWLHCLCVGDSPAMLPGTSDARVARACIVDHQQQYDNWGTATLQFESWAVVPNEIQSWGSFKGAYR